MENSPPYENPLVIGHPALREVSTPVADGSELPDNLIRTMNWIAMEDKRKKMNLVPALSAPQLGINKRIIGTGFGQFAYAGYNFRPRKVFEEFIITCWSRVLLRIWTKSAYWNELKVYPNFNLHLIQNFSVLVDF